ncbi:hypothetical protein AB0I45_12905 [Brevibacterium sp. NPDC049920]|uniref:Uncharacterized protein n=1 Tax=Brevibacterium pityocampae TaxID=506594 RepID=A0ABP8J8E8_9MICO|nr:hypothetical protein [uncultured Brevibacterium sp.]
MGIWDRLSRALRGAARNHAADPTGALRSTAGGRGRARGAERPGGARAADAQGLDHRLGTGLWRQHHDRFLRAVDRFYAIAVDLHSTAGSVPGEADAPVTSATESAEIIAQQTLVLNGLADRVGALTETVHARFPLDGLVVPAEVRARVGQLPALLSKAAAKTAEAGQAAAMARAALRSGTDPLPAARSARSYATDAITLVDACERALHHD